MCKTWGRIRFRFSMLMPIRINSFLETTTMMMKLADPDNLNQCAQFMNFYKST